MKHPLRCLAVFALALCFTHLGNSCAYEGPETVFIRHSDPDPPYASYAAGRLGIVQPDYRIRHLVIAYDFLSGHPLTPDEQKAAVEVDDFYNTYGGYTAYSPPGSTTKTAWTEGPPIQPEHLVPGEQYEYFTNCLPDAFAHAAATLADIRAHYGEPGAADTPEIANWIEGQNAVFSNCGSAGQIPQPVAADAPLWLRQDRAYQIAAAHFYALDYDAALAGFGAIAEDRGSPRSMLARYLVARAYIRQALVPDLPRKDAQQAKAALAEARASLAAARDRLQAILRDPAMEPMHEQSRQLLDYVMLRLDPAAQANVLAKRLTAPGGDPDYKQDTIDLTFAYNSASPFASTSMNGGETAPESGQTQQPLIRWLADLGANGRHSDDEGAPNTSAPQNPADALEMWRRTHGLQWLVAALTTAEPGAEGNAELMAAGRAIPPASPAYASATFQRLRLAAASPVPVERVPSFTAPVYAEISRLMPGIERSQPLSTINQFADLRARLSPTFDDFLAGAALRPASSSDFPIESDTQGSERSKPVTLCGVPIYASTTRHLDSQTALIFNQRLPLRMLEEAALSPELPANVRFEVAHMAWTRAVLLDEPQVARAVSPYLAGCQPAFAPWLDRYNAARTPGERHIEGLLALMRFTSTEPVVRAGLERDFAAYDYMRDNWWCSEDAYNSPNPLNRPFLFTEPIVPRIEQPDPPFIVAADRAQADEEIARLKKIPCASDYFARQALAWVKAHPDDSRDADAIGFAMRAVRNACRSGNTADLNHELFDTIHRQFPKSEWAARYKTWE